MGNNSSTPEVSSDTPKESENSKNSEINPPVNPPGDSLDKGKMEDHGQSSDLNDSRKCSICRNEKNLPVTLPCGDSFCFLCIKRVAESDFSSAKCPVCYSPVPSYIRETVKVPEGSIDVDQSRGKWMYSGRTSGWWFYSKEHSDEIERGWNDYHSRGVNLFRISILGRDYTIDFQRMTQNSQCGGITRDIKRLEDLDSGTVPKGIAGVRIVKKEEISTVQPKVNTFSSSEEDLSSTDEEENDPVSSEKSEASETWPPSILTQPE
jgi:hypothetical protein